MSTSIASVTRAYAESLPRVTISSPIAGRVEITYRGYTVYVVRNLYPKIATPDSAIRPACRRDLLDGGLGVLVEGRCVPLSQYEVDEIQRAVGR